MKVLLLGEYSNLHYTLACALRDMGHDVRLVSDGDEWKRYPADVKLVRRSTGLLDTIVYLFRLVREMRHWRGYDVVQLINPVHFIQLKAERGIRIYDWLRRHNRKVFLGAFGDDYYFIHASYVRRLLRYSDFYTPTREVTHSWNQHNLDCWLHNPGMVHSCQHIAQTCNGIIAALYEYYVAYTAVPDLAPKTTFIPLPIRSQQDNETTSQPMEQRAENGVYSNYPESRQRSSIAQQDNKSHPLRFFIGIQRQRSALKGTDILLKVARELQARYPNRMELVTAENLPYDEYMKLREDCDVLLDQIYSYTPAMNALQAMAHGIVVVSGGEEEQYELLNEHELRPIINTQPEEESVRAALEDLILHPERLPELRRQSILYVQRHHESHKVAQQYLDFWAANR
jgi:glycosyltransferase involved in cell wall biosynthesis